MIHNKVHEKTDSLIYLHPPPFPLVPCSPSFSFPPRSLRSDVKAAPILLQDMGKNRINCNSVCICNSVVCIMEQWSQVVHLIKLGMNYRTLADTVQLFLQNLPCLTFLATPPPPKGHETTSTTTVHFVTCRTGIGRVWGGIGAVYLGSFQVQSKAMPHWQSTVQKRTGKRHALAHARAARQ